MTRTFLASALLLPLLLLTACGGDDGDSDGSGDGGSDGSGDSTGAAETLPPDQAAVHDALLASFFDPSCDLLTEEYLVEKALLAETPEEACTEHEQSWVEPLYDEDAVLISDITITGDVATAVVGSDITDLTTTYELTQVDGTWLVSCDDFLCDDLPQPSTEPSTQP